MTFTLMPKWAGISQPSHFATWEGLQPTRHQSPLRPVPAEANLNTLQDLSTSLNEFNISQLLIFLHHLLHAYGRTIPSCVGGSIHSSSGDSPGIRNAAGIAAPSGRKMLLRSSQHHPHNLHRYLMISHTSIHSPILGLYFHLHMPMEINGKQSSGKGAATAAVLHLRLLQPHPSGFSDSMQQREP